jgi:hypothetical protein
MTASERAFELDRSGHATTVEGIRASFSARPFGAAIGAGLTLLFGFGPAVAVLAALAALDVLPVLRAFAVALAMCPPCPSGLLVRRAGCPAVYSSGRDLRRRPEPPARRQPALSRPPRSRGR